MIIKLQLNDIHAMRKMFQEIERYEPWSSDNILNDAIDILSAEKQSSLSMAVAQAIIDDEPGDSHDTPESICKEWRSS